MVMIISSTDDYSTNDVISWLIYNKIKFIRISIDDVIEYENFEINNDALNFKFTINGKKYELSEFKSFWYRRSHFNLKFIKILNNNNVSKQINKHLFIENNELHKMFLVYIKSKSLNNYSDLQINKLEVLHYAQKFKIKIPNSLITNTKEEVKIFFLNTKTLSLKIFHKVFLFLIKARCLVQLQNPLIKTS